MKPGPTITKESTGEKIIKIDSAADVAETIDKMEGALRFRIAVHWIGVSGAISR